MEMSIVQTFSIRLLHRRSQDVGDVKEWIREALTGVIDDFKALRISTLGSYTYGETIEGELIVGHFQQLSEDELIKYLSNLPSGINIEKLVKID